MKVNKLFFARQTTKIKMVNPKLSLLGNDTHTVERVNISVCLQKKRADIFVAVDRTPMERRPRFLILE